MSQAITLQELSSEIKHRAQDRARIVIALSGFGGSGKSTIAKALLETLGDGEIIHLDDFIHDQLSQRSDSWEGFEWDRLVEEVLRPIAEGADVVEYGVYHWPSNKIVEKRKVALPKYIILEGVGLIRDNLKKYFDVTIWIDVPLVVATERGKRRDVEEYKVPHHAELWDTIWTPNDADYFRKFVPNEKADFLLKNE
jgi:uridine kinase